LGRNTVRGWIVRCKTCGTIWVLEVSFDLRNTKEVYHYCKICKKNTFHEILGRTERWNK